MNKYTGIILFMFEFDLTILVLVLEIYVFIIYILPCGLLVPILSLLGMASIDVSIIIIIIDAIFRATIGDKND